MLKNSNKIDGSTIVDYIEIAGVWFGLAVAAALVIFILYRIIYRFVEFKRSLDLVMLKVTLPKKTSQMDKEQEVAKDMKETVSIMQQLLATLSTQKKYEFKFKETYVLEYIAKFESISFMIGCSYAQKEMVENIVNSYYGDAVVEELADYNIFPEDTYVSACASSLNSKTMNPLNTFQTLGVDPINAITNALSKIKRDEAAAISFVIRPLRSGWGNGARSYVAKKYGAARNPKEGKRATVMTQTDEEFLKLIEQKADQVGFGVTMRIIACSSSKLDSKQLLSQVKTSFGQFAKPSSNHIIFKEMRKKKIIKDYMFKTMGFGSTVMHLSGEELASMFHFPSAVYNLAPSICWQKFKFLPPPAGLPSEDEAEVYLGENKFRGVSTPVWMKGVDRFRHFYVIGQTGTGKSTILKTMAAQDIIAGRGVCLMDPHGELAEGLLGVVPKERVDDVVYFNPGDVTRPMGLNLLEAKGSDERERVAMDSLAMMIKLFGEEIFSPRLQEYFQNAVLTLMEDEEDPGTLIDVVRLFTDEPYQKAKVAKVTNSTVLKWWNSTYANMGDRERQEIIPYFSSKFNQFSTNMMMRNIVGQQKSAFDIEDIMNNKKILLVNLAKGKLGDMNSSLIGMILVSKIQGAAMARTKMSEEERVPFFLYLDEFQNTVTDAIESILSEARKYKLSLNIAHQYLAQLDKVEEVKKAVFGNIGSMMSYKIGAEDAEYMAKEFAPVVSNQDLVNIAVRTGVIKMAMNGQPSIPFTLHPPPPPEENPKMIKALTQLSRLKYGRDAKFINREIDLRMKGA